jgi:hypothetical protein
MDAGHVRNFLRHLAMDRQVAASTQNQAVRAVVYSFKSVPKWEIRPVKSTTIINEPKSPL